MRLMELVAQDVYGEQTLMRSGAVPAALTLGHHAWMPCLHHLRPPTAHWLGMASFEVGQDAQGQCWVLGSSTTLQDVLAPVLQPHPHELSRNWMTHWRNTWPVPPQEHATCVVLAASLQPDRSTEWGTLCWVTSDELQVRSGRLWMLRPSGWQPVHALIAHDDQLANDPLEGVDADGGGVAGWLSCIRQHTLSVINMPGMGFLNEAAWSAFWPSLCQQLLGEPLLLPSPASWWLGEELARQQAQALTLDARLLPQDAGPAQQPIASTIALAPGVPAGQQAAWDVVVQRPEAWTLQQHLQIESAWRVDACATPTGPSGMVQIQATCGPVLETCA
jgi:uncharacterized circularly permuted ATP-grasp superfamily protein